MIKQLVYVGFSEYSENGISYSLFDEHMREYLDNEGVRKYLCTVELPETSNDDVVSMATKQIDKEIIGLQVQITHKQEKKKQLLAIEYQGESL